jgi:hypothetical protein
MVIKHRRKIATLAKKLAIEPPTNGKVLEREPLISAAPLKGQN